jgi:hypothetical protein
VVGLPQAAVTRHGIPLPVPGASPGPSIIRYSHLCTNIMLVGIHFISFDITKPQVHPLHCEGSTNM